MNIKQLKYIIAIAKHKHFTRAAESCDIAQSTLSREVQKLELELEVMIFDRTRTPVVPTQKGKELIEIANKIIFKINSLEQIAKSKETTKTEFFNLGIWSCISPYVLPVFLKAFSRNFSNVKLNIIEVSLNDTHEKWNLHKLDGCILPNLIQKNGYYTSLLYEEEFMIYKGQLSHKSTETLTGIIHSDLKPVYDKDLKLKGILSKNELSYQNTSIETIRKIVDYSGGYTLIPKTYYTFKEQNTNNIHDIQFENSSKVKINFVSPRIFEKESIIKSIKGEFKKLFSNPIEKTL